MVVGLSSVRMYSAWGWITLCQWIWLSHWNVQLSKLHVTFYAVFT